MSRALSRLIAIILWRRETFDYLVAALIGAIPALIALSVGVAWTRTPYTGFLQSQWVLWPVILPLELLVVRYVAQRLVPVDVRQAPLISLFERSEQARASAAFWAACADWRNAAVALAVAVSITLIDVFEVLTCYWEFERSGRCVPRERDWSVFFTAFPDVGVAANATLIVAAYSIQGLGTLIGVLIAVLLARHNLFFLRSIYQRVRHADRAGATIKLDLEDENGCFGLKRAYAAFNLQVWVLAIAGLVFLISRIPNVGAAQREAITGITGDIVDLAEFKFHTALPAIWNAMVFPDIGQWIPLIAWLITLGIVCLPILVKFLPTLPPAPKWGIDDFIREYIPPRSAMDKELGNPPKRKRLRELVRSFARAAWWPTGNTKAHLLFWIAVWVLAWLLLPLRPEASLVFLIFQIAIAVSAFAWVGAMFLVLRFALRTASDSFGGGSSNDDD